MRGLLRKFGDYCCEINTHSTQAQFPFKMETREIEYGCDVHAQDFAPRTP